VSNEAVKRVVQRAISDGAFRRQLSTDPTTALRGFDLNAAEAAAIRSGDAGRLSAFGVDLRMSKAFNLGGNDGTASSVSNVVASDLSARGSGVLSSFNSSTLESGDSMRNAALISGDTSDTDPMIAGGNETNREGANIAGEPSHALGAQTGSDGGTALPDEADQYSPSFHSSTENVIVSDGGASGASTPGEASEGPNITP
jgi:hypothetical protein